MSKLSSYQKQKHEILFLRNQISELVNNPNSMKSLEIKTAHKINSTYENMLWYGSHKTDIAGCGLLPLLEVAE